MARPAEEWSAEEAEVPPSAPQAGCSRCSSGPCRRHEQRSVSPVVSDAAAAAAAVAAAALATAAAAEGAAGLRRGLGGGAPPGAGPRVAG